MTTLTPDRQAAGQSGPPPASLAPGGGGGPGEPDQRSDRGRLFGHKRLRELNATVWMVVIIFLPIVVVVGTVWGGFDHRPADVDEAGRAFLKLALVWCLSFLPGWLYVRFLGQRASALWNEYVLNLHRLGWDQPQFLPEPPRASQFHQEWLNGHGDNVGGAERNIYRQKFDAYFGRAVADEATSSGDGTHGADKHDDFTVRTDSMFPVFMATAFISTAWTAVLWDEGFIANPSTVWDVLKFAFVGAYMFTLQSLVRRFFQSDLRPSAYASALLRFIVVLSVMVALHQLIEGQANTTEAVVAFVVGIFPVMALQALQRMAAAVLGLAVDNVTPDYPLRQLDGLDLWYEARLVEVGIEDMQNLATANLVDVMLHTRVPVTRLIDWVDQALLYLHLDRAERGVVELRRAKQVQQRSRDGRFMRRDEQPQTAASTAGAVAASAAGEPTPEAADPGSGIVHTRPGSQLRHDLRQLGIRTATDLLCAFPPQRKATEREVCKSNGRSANAPLREAGLDVFRVQTLVRVISADPRLIAVQNWHERGVPRYSRRAAAARGRHTETNGAHGGPGAGADEGSGMT